MRLVMLVCVFVATCAAQDPLEYELDVLRQRVATMEKRYADLLERLAFLERHSPEARQARADDAEKAQDAAAVASAAAAEVRRLNTIIKEVANNGRMLVMAGGGVLVVGVQSQAYVRRWTPGATLERVEQPAPAGWFWIRHPSARKGEDTALVRGE
jgi:hypothetical protein